MGSTGEELVSAGIMLVADSLKPSSHDMDEAVAWVKRCRNPVPGPSEIEIRPLFETADLRRESDAAVSP